jgi:hypothetical protein
MDDFRYSKANSLLSVSCPNTGSFFFRPAINATRHNAAIILNISIIFLIPNRYTASDSGVSPPSLSPFGTAFTAKLTQTSDGY